MCTPHTFPLTHERSSSLDIILVLIISFFSSETFLISFNSLPYVICHCSYDSNESAENKVINQLLIRNPADTFSPYVTCSLLCFSCSILLSSWSTHCYELNCVPIRYNEVPFPVPVHITLFGKKSFCSCDQVNMRSLGFLLIWYDWCPYKRRKIWNTQTNPQRGECHVKIPAKRVAGHLKVEAELGVM